MVRVKIEITSAQVELGYRSTFFQRMRTILFACIFLGAVEAESAGNFADDCTIKNQRVLFLDINIFKERARIRRMLEDRLTPIGLESADRVSKRLRKRSYKKV